MQRFGELPSDGQGFIEWDRALSDPVLACIIREGPDSTAERA